MRRSKLHSLLGLFVALALVFPFGPAVAQHEAAAPLVPPPPDAVAQLRAETGAEVRLTRHPATGQVSFLALRGGAWHSAAGAALAAAPEASAAAVAEASARDFLGAYGSLFGLSSAPGELSVLRAPVRDDGRAYVRFQQHVQGVPVFGGELIVQVDKSGNVEAVIGEALPDVSLDTTPTVAGPAARQTALDSVAAPNGTTASSLLAGEPALWLYQPSLTEPNGGPTRLVWRFEVTPIALRPIRQLVLVDAHTGAVALSFNQIDTVLNRQTYDANNGTTLPGTLQCDETNPTCSGGDAHEVAAHLHAGQTYTFYLNLHGRDSIDDAGLTLISTVHYDSGYFNAFWNGTQMVYGDAADFPLADDVVAHELTHGVTDYESELFYYYQSGAINESLSDVWGEFLDLTNGTGTDTAPVRWQMGEDATGLGAIRDMEDPTLFNDPDKMTSNLYRSVSGDVSNSAFDNGGVHHNSGVNNKAAFLMTDGGSFNGRTVTALGITKTAVIYYHTATNLLVSGSDYLNLYDALQQSCATLTGTNGITAGNCVEVKDALDAVEMNLQPVPDHNTEAAKCPLGYEVGSTLFFDDLEGGAGNWVTQIIAGSNRWFYGSSFAHSGTFHLLGDDSTTAIDSAVAMNTSYTLPVNSYLHFAHAFGFQGNGDDGGIVQYSTNGGGSWTDLGPLFQDHGYNGTISDGPQVGVSGFISDSHGYIASRASLASLSGQSVRFRFRMSNDTGGVDRGWYVDDISLHTCNVSGSASLVYLPLVAKNHPQPSGSWQTIVSEGFEGSFPTGLWQVSDPGFDEYFWAKRNCRAASGSFSAWAMGGGSIGAGLGCGANYIDFAFSWMIYGPFSLADATDAEYDVQLWLNSESGFDGACQMASVNGNNFYGTCHSGSSGGVFVPEELDLTNVFTLGDLRGQSSVWIAMLFDADDSVNLAEGAHVDDLVVRKCVGGTCTTAAAAASPSGLTSTPATFDLSAQPAR